MIKIVHPLIPYWYCCVFLYIIPYHKYFVVKRADTMPIIVHKADKHVWHQLWALLMEKLWCFGDMYWILGKDLFYKTIYITIFMAYNNIYPICIPQLLMFQIWLPSTQNNVNKFPHHYKPIKYTYTIYKQMKSNHQYTKLLPIFLILVYSTSCASTCHALCNCTNTVCNSCY